VFSNAKIDEIQHVDAIVVLSGNDHDGREDYGLRLAREGLASTVVFSNLFPADDPVMSRVCKPAAGSTSSVRNRRRPPRGARP